MMGQRGTSLVGPCCLVTFWATETLDWRLGFVRFPLKDRESAAGSTPGRESRSRERERGGGGRSMTTTTTTTNGLWIRSAVAVVLSSTIAARSLKRRSLDRSGALAGFLVMAIHLAAGFRFGALLLVFFFTSSKLTKLGEEKKRAVDEDFKEGGQRNWLQVLANSLIATILVIVVAMKTGGQDRCLDTKESTLITGLVGGVIGHYACCNGDTWSSEIGMLSNTEPRLITTFKRVRKGTNGGVTMNGLLAAAAAGTVIGLTYVIVGLLTADCATDVFLRQLLVVPLAAAAGLCGSLIDSLLGATLQFSGYCTLRKKVVGKPGPTVRRISGMRILDNNAVNAVSVLLTTLLTATACLYLF